MNISFNGINNLRIFKSKEQVKNMIYPTDSGDFTKGNVYAQTTVIDAYLDNNGNKDLTEFKNTLKKLRPCYQINCVDKNSPEHFRLESTSYEAKNLAKTSIFKLNGYQILLDEDQILPLFTYFAKFTRTQARNSERSTAQREILANINQAIQNRVQSYIDLTTYI